MMLEGENGLSHALTVPFEAWALRGEDPIYARLVNGPAHDFNVMVRRGRVRATLKVWRTDEFVQCEGSEALFFCAAGVYRIADTVLTAGMAGQLAEANRLAISREAPDSVLIGVFLETISQP